MSKKYFHRYAGAKFFLPNGKELSFAGGELDTANMHPGDAQMVEQELDKIANVPSSMIYTKDLVADSSEGDVVDEILASATQGFDELNKIPAGTKTVALPMGETTKPTLKQPGTSGSNIAAASNKAAAQHVDAAVNAEVTNKVAAARAAIAAAAAAKPANGNGAGIQEIKKVS